MEFYFPDVRNLWALWSCDVCFPSPHKVAHSMDAQAHEGEKTKYPFLKICCLDYFCPTWPVLCPQRPQKSLGFLAEGKEHALLQVNWWYGLLKFNVLSMKLLWYIFTDCAVSGSSLFDLMCSCLSEYKDTGIPFTWCCFWLYVSCPRRKTKSFRNCLVIIFHLASIVLTIMPVGRKKIKFPVNQSCLPFFDLDWNFTERRKLVGVILRIRI